MDRHETQAQDQELDWRALCAARDAARPADYRHAVRDFHARLKAARLEHARLALQRFKRS